MSNQTLLANAAFAADGNGSNIVVDPGNDVILSIYTGANATIGGGTLTLQVSPDGGTTFVDTADISVTVVSADSLVAHVQAKGSLFRLNLNGSTAPNLDIDVTVIETRSRGTGNQERIGVGSGSSSFTVDGTSVVHRNVRNDSQQVAWSAVGTFGSGTVTLQYTIDGGTTWKDADTLSADGYAKVSTGLVLSEVDDNVYAFLDQWRFVLSGSTSPVLTARLYF